MDGVCKELDEVKLELDKIKDEYRIKSELVKNLRKANDDQAVRNEEMKSQMEKLAQELSKKEEEMAESRHLYEDVKYRLQETDSSLKHVNCVNEKLRIDYGEKVQRLEEENRQLVSALDEATLNTSELDRQLRASREEVAGLKVLVLDSQRKCLESEQKIELKKELSNRDDAIMKLEEECTGVQDRLKWKTEQFEHLEEAHKLLQEQFQSSKQEWASEKTALLHEISSLQISLDTQVRRSENLQTELKMCNQALAHEESRRKAVEMQLSDSKACFENVLGEFNEAKSKIDNLGMERDEKVAALRNALGTKNAHVKEMEYRISHLEQENKELLHSVKELQEAQIGRKKPDSSFIRLRNKLRDLEQTHNRCSVILEEREAEWDMKMEKMKGEVTRCEFDLKAKAEEINQLKMQMESCQSSIDISGEEISILLMVLKCGFSEVYSKVLAFQVESDAQKEEFEEKLAVSGKPEAESDSQMKAEPHHGQAREEIASLSKKLEALKLVENKNTLLENELDKCRKMLDESSIRQLRLEEHAAMVEGSAKQMRDAVVDLQKEKAQLEEEWKATKLLAKADAEKFKQEMEKLYMIAEAKDQSTRDLQALVSTLEQNFMDTTVSSFSENFEMLIKNGALREVVEDHAALMETSAKQMRDAVVGLQKEKAQLLEEEWKRRELLAKADAEKFQQEMEKLHMIAEAKDQSTRDLQALVSTLEQNFMDATVSSFSETFEMLLKNGALREAVENAEYLITTAVQEKKSLASAFEKESAALRSKIVHVEGSLLCAQNRATELEALLEHNTQEMDIVKSDLRNVQGNYKKVEKEVEEKRSLVCELEKESTDQRSKIVHVEESLLYAQNKALELEALLEHKTQEMDVVKNVLRNTQGNYKKMETEVQEKKSLVSALEKYSAELRSKVAHIEESLLNSQNREMELKAILEYKTMEMDSLKGDLGNLQSQHKTAENEVEEKKVLVSALEKESADLLAKVLHIEESLFDSQNREKDLEDLLQHKALEMDSLKDDLRKAQVKYKKVETELELTKEALTEDIRTLSCEKECLIACIEGVYEQVEGFHDDDAKLMGMLDKMWDHCEENGKMLTEGIVVGRSEVVDRVKDDNFSNKGNALKGNLDRRVVPLRELNN